MNEHAAAEREVRLAFAEELARGASPYRPMSDEHFWACQGRQLGECSWTWLWQSAAIEKWRGGL